MFIKNNRRTAFLFLIFCVVCYSTNAQVKLSARLDSTRIVVGGITHLNVTIQAPEGTEIITPRLRDSSDIELIDEVKTVKTPHNGGLLITQVWTLTALDSGSFTLPILPFGYKLASGSIDTVYSPALALSVMPAKLDSLTLRPIAPIIDEPLTWRDVLPFFIGALVLLLVVYAIYWYYNRKKMREIATQTAPELIIPPHLIAFEKLVNLQKQAYWQNGNLKKYYIELTYILREYLEKRYEIPVLEQTTDEFLPVLKRKTDIPIDIFNELQQQLSTADLIKFAKGEATAEQNAAALDFAFLLIERTRKIELDTKN